MPILTDSSVASDWVEPDDVVAALRYLVEAKSVTGEVMTIDGGQRFMGLSRDVQFLGDQ